MIVKNAQITETALGYEDHGILTIEIGVGYGEGTTQMFGGYSLGGNKDSDGKYVHRWITQLLDVVGVRHWENLKGKYIRVEKESEYGKIIRIGNLLEDKWFSPVE